MTEKKTEQKEEAMKQQGDLGTVIAQAQKAMQDMSEEVNKLTEKRDNTRMEQARIQGRLDILVQLKQQEDMMKAAQINDKGG